MISPVPEAHDNALALARQVMNRADLLAQISEEQGVLTRRYGTEAMRRADTLAAEWMREAGMSVRIDAIGNLLGRLEETSGGRAFVVGSHLDTVRDAGKYDGPLGVLVAIACAQRLKQRGTKLPFSLEIAAFADEEGLRYHTAYLGSKAYAGAFDPACLQTVDADGIPMADAVRAFGGDPQALLKGGSAPADILGYCEVHIEQGPVLEHEGLPLGVVSAIAGQSRLSVRFIGEAGHAGTVPMRLRHDALCAAAEFILAAESTARDVPGLVATVGQITAQPGASNVIPGAVTLSLDVRHIEDAIREEAALSLQNKASEICARRGVALDWHSVQETPSVPCDPALARALAEAVDATGCPAYYLPSGAGHDAVTMSLLAPVAMLFVRCKGGVSHNPAESVEVEDVAAAIEALSAFLHSLAEKQ